MLYFGNSTPNVKSLLDAITRVLRIGIIDEDVASVTATMRMSTMPKQRMCTTVHQYSRTDKDQEQRGRREIIRLEIKPAQTISLAKPIQEKRVDSSTNTLTSDRKPTSLELKKKKESPPDKLRYESKTNESTSPIRQRPDVKDKSPEIQL